MLTTPTHPGAMTPAALLTRTAYRLALAAATLATTAAALFAAVALI